MNLSDVLALHRLNCLTYVQRFLLLLLVLPFLYHRHFRPDINCQACARECLSRICHATQPGEKGRRLCESRSSSLPLQGKPRATPRRGNVLEYIRHRASVTGVAVHSLVAYGRSWAPNFPSSPGTPCSVDRLNDYNSASSSSNNDYNSNSDGNNDNGR